MYLRGNPFGPSTSLYDDYRSAVAVGIVLGAYVGFFFALYWLMQPSVSANPGLAGYRPPPKTVVHYAGSPWVPPAPSEALPIPTATEPAPEVAKAASPRRKRRRNKRHGQLLDGRAPLESSQIRSGAMPHPDHPVLAPGSDRRSWTFGGMRRHRRRMPLEAEFDTRPSERKSSGSAIGTARVQPPPHGEGNPRARGLQPYTPSHHVTVLGYVAPSTHPRKPHLLLLVECLVEAR